jgi:hypothetical protein
MMVTGRDLLPPAPVSSLSVGYQVLKRLKRQPATQQILLATVELLDIIFKNQPETPRLGPPHA